MDNGLRVLVVPMSNLESAALTVWVGVGSRYEKDEQAGISHFLEHMVYKGSKKRPTSMDVSYAIDAIGSEANAGTSREWTNFYIKARSGVIEDAFDILSDVVLNPLLKKDDIEMEKGVIIEEIARKEDDPSDKVGENFVNTIFSGNPLARDIAGFPETVKNITRDDFLRYRKSHYDAGNMLVTVSGSVSESQIMKLAEKYFKNIENGKRTTPEKFDHNQKKPKLSFESKKTEQSHFYVGFVGHGRDYDGRYAESVLTTIMGRGFSSRLWMEIREKRGLAYSVGSSISRYADTGLYATYAGTDVKKSEDTIKIILDQSYGMAAEKYPITDQELNKAKEYVKGRIALALEDTLAVNDYFGLRALFMDKIETPQEMFEKIDKVTSEDVVEAAKNLFVPDKLTLAIIGPYKSESKFRKLLD